ncbi:MAG: polyprenol monophosphomannose synthase [Akkermansiaceae bacterium]|nr:polyprenol monophosphomannose synthase [Akkermansiaceae bacterium]MCP5543844.1 polyprenol monophosphomannose synthase [Akkermansiaceae bacterium]MCP5546486.1 polyprenol monophosphomannose synthase [Akkermansiaceae bacterium]
MIIGCRAVLVVPTYQEAANLPELLEGIFRSVPDLRVLIVNDASGDGTAEWLRAHPAYGGRVFLLQRAGKSGFASALCDGYRWALAQDAEIILQMDADLSHDPRDLPRLIEALNDGAGMAIGSRYCPGGAIRHWSRWRRFLSRAAGAYVRIWTGLPLHDPTAGLRAFRRAVLEAVMSTPKRCDGYGFQVETAHAAWKHGSIVKEIPVVFSERREGRSKLSSRIVWEAVLRVPFL